MRRLFWIPLIVILAGPLGGCAGNAGAQFVENALKLPAGVLTTSVQNPVTKSTLYKLENALRVGVVALKSYKNLCENGTLEESCIDVVVRLQSYSRRSRPLLRQLRTFVRKNDQVNAQVVFTTIKGLIMEFRTTAVAAGIPVPAALEIQ